MNTTFKRVLIVTVTIPLLILAGWISWVGYLIFIEPQFTVHSMPLVSTSLSDYDTNLQVEQDFYDSLNSFKTQHRLSLYDLSELVAVLNLQGMVYQYRFKGDIYPNSALSVMPEDFHYDLNATDVKDDDPISRDEKKNIVLIDKSADDLSQKVNQLYSEDACHISILIIDHKKVLYLSTKNSFGFYVKDILYEETNSPHQPDIAANIKVTDSLIDSDTICFYQKVPVNHNLTINSLLPADFDDNKADLIKQLTTQLNQFKHEHDISLGAMGEMLAKSNLPTVRLLYPNRFTDGDLQLTPSHYQIDPPTTALTTTAPTLPDLSRDANNDTNKPYLMLFVEDNQRQKQLIMAKPIDDYKEITLLAFLDKKSFVYHLDKMTQVMVPNKMMPNKK